MRKKMIEHMEVEAFGKTFNFPVRAQLHDPGTLHREEEEKRT